MWYYASNHQPVGPVSIETIQELLRSGAINALTQVWREGMPNWKHLGETELAELSKNVAPIPPATYLGRSMPSAPTPMMVTNVPQYPRVKTGTLKSLFTWWAILMGIVTIYDVVINLIPNNSAMVAISCIAEIIILAFVVLQFMLLYRFWQIIQDGFASTTPGKAVGFLFIPFFNFYWFFRAYFGLAKDQNRYIARHFDSKPGVEVRKAHPALSLSFLIVSFTGGVILYSSIFAKAFSSSLSGMGTNSLTDIMAQYSVPIVIFALITSILSFLMYTDFYLTAKNIVEAEEHQ